jgi:hypothetical protein
MVAGRRTTFTADESTAAACTVDTRSAAAATIVTTAIRARCPLEGYTWG